MRATSPFDEKRCVLTCEHIAHQIVHPLVQRNFRNSDSGVDVKADGSRVTSTDREIESRVRSYLSEHFPEFGILGEEFGLERGDAEYIWTIDPIDGTEAFIAGLPTFGTLIAVIRQHDQERLPVLGALYLPVQDQLVIGNRVRATLNGEALRSNGVADDVLVLGNIAECAKHMRPAQWKALRSRARAYRSVQTWGDCLGYVNLLTGRVEARLEFGLGIDDVAPLEPILLGAGASVSCADGMPLSRALSNLNELSDQIAFGVLSAINGETHHAILSDLMLDRE